MDPSKMALTICDNHEVFWTIKWWNFHQFT
jgi:hypothetical protein